MPVSAPQTDWPWSTLPAEQQVPKPAGGAILRARPDERAIQLATLRAVRHMTRLLERQIELLEGLQDASPQGALVIERAGPGAIASDVFRRQANNLAVEVYASGASPQATITVRDCPIGGTPTPATDQNAVRTITAPYTKYFLDGVLDELQVSAQITAGVFTVRVGWAEGYPREGTLTGSGTVLNVSALAVTAGTPVSSGFTTPAAQRFVITGYSLSLSVAGSILLKGSSGATYVQTPAMPAGGNVSASGLWVPFASLGESLNFDVSATGAITGYVTYRLTS